ncbi:MAG: CotH kinase family protein [Bacteroidetes bacterium]|nr:CotH kinase family protein [Bacteroidota bacterium]
MFKRIFPVILFLLLSSCNYVDGLLTDTEDSQSSRMLMCDEFSKRFDNGESYVDIDHNNGETTIIFTDGQKFTIPDQVVSMRVCDLDEWPEITTNSENQWHIDKSYLPAWTYSNPMLVVSALHSNGALYIIRSDGNVLYFHKNVTKDFGYFKLEKRLNPTLSKDILGVQNNNVISFELPAGIESTNFIPTISYRGSQMKVNGEPYEHVKTTIDLSVVQKFEYLNYKGEESVVTTNVNWTYKQLPTARLNVTSNSINSLTSYADVTLDLTDADMVYSNSSENKYDIKIKGFKSDTWATPKKSYEIEVADDANFLGLDSDKDFILLSCYSDKALLRTATAIRLSSILRMNWIPDFRFVELYFKEKYHGLYLVIEKPKMSENRVLGSVFTGEDCDYLIKADDKGEGSVFNSSEGIRFVVESPETPSTEQMNYITKSVNDLEKSFVDGNFQEKLDLKSFVSNYIVQELTKNVYGAIKRDVYFSKNKGGKLAVSNVWNFDIALGNCDFFADVSPTVDNTSLGFYILKNNWYSSLVTNQVFIDELKRQWALVYPQLDEIYTYIDRTSKLINNAQVRNFTKWPILNEKVWPNVDAKGSYSAELSYMKLFLKQRADWLNTEIANM